MGAISSIDERRHELGWPDLPDQDVSAIEQYANDLRKRIDAFVVLGISGSALGCVAVCVEVRRTYE